MQKINMNKYGVLRYRFTVSYDNGNYTDFRYTKYNKEGKVVKREEGKNVSTLFTPGDKNNKFIIIAIMYNLIKYLEERGLYDSHTRVDIENENPEVVKVYHSEIEKFKDLSRSETYFKKIKYSMMKSSYSAIFPAEITDELGDMGFKYGELWAITYINYVNGLPSKTELYLYSVKKDKLEDLVSDIDNTEKYIV